MARRDFRERHGSKSDRVRYLCDKGNHGAGVEFEIEFDIGIPEQQRKKKKPQRFRSSDEADNHVTGFAFPLVLSSTHSEGVRSMLRKCFVNTGESFSTMRNYKSQ